MTIMGLQKWSRRKKVGYKLIWIGMALVMAVGTIQSFGGRGPGGGGRGAVSEAPDPIASVAGIAISRQMFNQRLAQQMMMMGGRNADLGILRFIKQNAFNGGEQSVVVGALLEQAAGKLGLAVSDTDVYQTIDQNVESQMSMLSRSGDRKRVQLKIEKEYGSMEKFKEKMRKDSMESAEEIRRNLLLQRLHEKITAEVKVTEKDYVDSLKKVKVRQIFVKTKTPAPGKAEEAEKGKAGASNPDGDARQEATNILKIVKKEPERFEFFAKQSDEVTYDKSGKKIAAAENGGLIGWIGRNEKKWQYGDDYEESVFKAKGGELIDHVMKGTDGYRVVKVEEVKTEFPKDYDKVKYKCENKEAAKNKSDKPKPCDYEVESDKKPEQCPKCGSTKFKVVSKQKDTLFSGFKQQKQEEHWREFVTKISKDADAKVQIFDPELLAMKMENEAQADPAKLRMVVDKYKEALKYANSDPFIKSASLHMLLATVYGRLGEKSNQIAELKETLKVHPDPSLDLQLANLLIEQWEGQHGDKDAKKSADAKKARTEAIARLQEASRETGEQQAYLHTNIAEAYKRLGMAKEEEAEREKPITELKKKVAAKEPPPDANTYLQLADALINKWDRLSKASDSKQKDAAEKAKEEAVTQLEEASKLAKDQTTLHTSIAEAYKRLAMKTEEAAERKKAKPAITKKPGDKATNATE